MNTNITNNYTEISIGGGDWITESYPTNFHSFFKKKILSKGERIEDYKEITDAEKVSLENLVYIEPDDTFIKNWEYVGGAYNLKTGYFELNGLVDITYDEAKLIYKAGAITSLDCAHKYSHSNIRTNLPPNIGGISFGSTSSGAFMLYTFKDCNHLEVANIQTNPFAPTTLTMVPSTDNFKGTDSIFHNCSKLKRIIGSLDIGRFQKISANKCIVRNAPELEEFYMCYLRSNLNLEDCPKLNLDSFKFLVRYRHLQLENECVVTVHPDVFSKFTDDPEWNLVLLDAAEKQIQFVTI